MPNDLKAEILEFLESNALRSSKEIHEGIKSGKAYATIKRALTALVSQQYVVTEGIGKGRKYRIGPVYELSRPVNVEKYFEKEIDERQVKDRFNHGLITGILTDVDFFNVEEQQHLNFLHHQFKENITHLDSAAYSKELERLAIDLSWKSSQIEGNTYSLLETERLLKDKETAMGKPKDDATMLLNHKEAIEFIVQNPDYVVPLSVSRIEDIHTILMGGLGVTRNIRQNRVGISGTNYRPLDNEHQIRDALRDMCDLINRKENVFEKALLALVLLSYIQGFVDGNKRTARIVSNAILMAYQYCPLSYRTVDAMEYKKAILIFYEQNNVSVIKKIFIDQFEFAVQTYF